MTDTARVYGSSLYALAAEEGISDRVLNELAGTVRILAENPEYVTLLGTPSIPKEERTENITKAFGGRVHPYLVNFLKLLTERGSVSELPGCLEAYTAEYNEANGILPVTAVSAAPLSRDQQERLREKLCAITGKKAVLTVTVDPRVLGGIRLTMDGRLYDGTVRTRLSEIEKALRSKVL